MAGPDSNGGRAGQAVFNLVLAYADFWRKAVGRRGWEVPPFTFDEVRPLLQRAAEIVTCIHERLAGDSEGSMPAHMIDGAAHEYLFSIKKHPKSNPDRFVRGVVHHTLRNTAGYVLGLTADKVTAYIAEFDPAVRSADGASGTMDEAARAKMKAALQQLAVAWGNACSSVGAVLSVNPDDFIAHHNRWDIPKLERMASEMWALTHTASESFADLQTRKRRKHKRRKTTADGNTHSQSHGHGHGQGAKAAKGPSVEAEIASATRGLGTGAAASGGALPPTPHPTPVNAPGMNAAGVKRGKSSLGTSATTTTTTADSATGGPGRGCREGSCDICVPRGAEEEASTDGEWETEEEDVAPFASAAAPEKHFNVGVQSVEQDITEIHEQLQRLTKALIEEDGSLRDHPQRGKGMVLVLLHRCQEYLESLATDMAIIKGLHLPADQEGEEVRHLQAAADEVIRMSQHLAALGVRLEENMETYAASTASQPSSTPVAERLAEVTGGEVDAAGGGGGAATEATARATASGARGPLGESSDHPAMEKVQQWFRALRLEPRVDIHETQAAFVLQMFVPNVKEEDVDILINKEKILIVKGFRAPTEAALKAMLSSLPKPWTKEGLLRLGIGQYGTFAEFFRLPANVDVAGISGEYQHGLLQITMAKVAPATTTTTTTTAAAAAASAAPVGDAHDLLKHPADGSHQHRRTFYSFPAPGHHASLSSERDDGEGDDEAETNEDGDATTRLGRRAAPLPASSAPSASARGPRMYYAGAPVLSTDPRTFGMVGAHPADGQPHFHAAASGARRQPRGFGAGMVDREFFPPATTTTTSKSASAAPPRSAATGATGGGPENRLHMVTFLDPSTGARFAVPLEAMVQMMAGERLNRQLQEQREDQRHHEEASSSIPVSRGSTDGAASGSQSRHRAETREGGMPPSTFYPMGAAGQRTVPSRAGIRERLW